MPTRPVIKRRSGLPSLYSRLDPQGNEIRLFAFDADVDGNITGSLKTYDLTDPQRPEWIALSYTWDLFEVSPHSPVPHRSTTEAFHRISINGHGHPIRENLHRALRTLLQKRSHSPASESVTDQQGARHGARDDRIPKYFSYAGSLKPKDWQYFWIDAICINQNDAEERQHQIGLMNRIFTQANAIVAWLTPYTADATTDLENTLLKVLDERQSGRSTGSRDSTQRYSLSPRMDVSDEELHHRAIVHNAYWNRMWIVQEVILARRITFLYGSSWLSEAFVHDLLNQDSSPATQILRHRDTFQRARRRRTTFDFQELIDNYSFKQCSDVRDRVFALIGLLPLDFPIRADYSLSALQIFLLLLEYQGQQATALHTRTWYLALDLDWRDPVVESHLWLHTYRKSHQPLVVAQAKQQPSDSHQAVPSLLDVVEMMVVWFHYNITVPVWLTFIGLLFRTIDLTYAGVLHLVLGLHLLSEKIPFALALQIMSNSFSSMVEVITSSPQNTGGRANRKLEWKNKPD